MEIWQVRKRVKAAIAASRERAQLRRQRNAHAEQAYERFLRDVATPTFQQVAAALKAEGYLFSVFTPGGGVRLASDRSRDDFIDLHLDTSGDYPEVVARVRHARGSRVIDEERPVKPGASPEAITDEDVLEFLVDALGIWLER